MRRYSFQLLRSKVKDKHTAPFIDDFIVRPEFLTAFLPKLRKIISKYKLMATIAGHMGDGNFHVIPLMKIEDPAERAKLEPAMKEVNKLVLKYHGSLTAEHNDGMIRGPWLTQMYGPRIVDLFRQPNILLTRLISSTPTKKPTLTGSFRCPTSVRNFKSTPPLACRLADFAPLKAFGAGRCCRLQYSFEVCEIHLSLCFTGA
jgi:hypothetical protein